MSQVINHYKYLHTIPELGFQEQQTSTYIAGKLKEAGYKVTEHVNGTTGIVAELDTGIPGPVFALRADMDALGHVIDGEKCARHTCGHDGHSSMVLTTAEEVAAEKKLKKGKFKVIFQPAEELGKGAIAMVEGGALDDVDMLIGCHVRPIQECGLGKAAVRMKYSSSVAIQAVITGKPAHGARPHLGVNALDAAVLAINAVNTIHLSPNVTYSVKPTRFLCDAGVVNAIPAEATIVFDLRADNNEDMATLKAKVKTAIECAAQSIGATANVEVMKEIPASPEPNLEVNAIIESAIENVLGKEGVIPMIATPGAEDFFYYPVLKPNLKAGFWGLGADLKPGLHHPDMHFDLAALETGVKVYKSCVAQVLY